MSIIDENSTRYSKVDTDEASRPVYLRGLGYFKQTRGIPEEHTDTDQSPGLRCERVR